MKPTSMVGDKGSWSELQSLSPVNIRSWQLCSVTLEDDFWSNVEKLVIERRQRIKSAFRPDASERVWRFVELRDFGLVDAAAVEYFESVTRSP